MAANGSYNAGGLCVTPTCLQVSSQFSQLMAPNWKNMDPCNNFDKMVCHGAMDRYEADKDTTDRFQDRNYRVLKEILDGGWDFASKFTTVPGQDVEEPSVADEQNYLKIKLDYDTCMNTTAIKAADAQPLVDLVKQVDSLWPVQNEDLQTTITEADYDGINKATTYLETLGVNTFGTWNLAPDYIQNDVWIVTLESAGLTLQDQSYSKPENREKYAQLIADVFMANTYPNNVTAGLAQSIANGIVEFEGSLALARSQMSEGTGDTVLSLDDVAKLAPALGVDKTIKSLAPQAEQVTVTSPEFLSKFSEIMHSAPKGIIQSWMIWKVITSYARYVDTPGVAGWLEYSKTAPDQTIPRGTYCVRSADFHMRWISANFFVKAAFREADGELGNKVLNELRSTLKDHVGKLDWIADDDKALIGLKVDRILQWVGYPTTKPNVKDPVDVSHFYESLNITDGYLANNVAYNKWYKLWFWSHGGQPYDRDEFYDIKANSMLSANAAYYSSSNSITIYAGDVQQTSFSVELPGYVNYGALGSVLGHELTHGFDSRGSLYNADRVKAPWWDNSTKEGFENRTQCFVDQYSEFQIASTNGSWPLDGKLTLAENIADAGGLSLAFDAWKASGAQDQDLPGMQDFTHEQLFFISFGSYWCNSYTPSYYSTEKKQTDNHSPDTVRILGTLQNSRPFKEAFNCPVKEPRCELW